MNRNIVLLFFITIIAGIGISVAAQNAPDPNPELQSSAQEELTPNNLEPTTAPEPPQPNPIYEPNQETSWAPAPEIIMDIPVEQEFINSSPSAPIKRTGLSNGGAEDEFQIEWSAVDLQNQAAIAQTQHRKREIDPRKRANLLALSRVFGGLHAIRMSCQGAADQTYRARMSSMLDMEAPIADFIRDPLINAFNSGFSDGGNGQRSCPKDSDVKEAQLAKAGYSLAMQMAQYYNSTP